MRPHPFLTWVSTKESRSRVVLQLVADNLPRLAIGLTHSNKTSRERLGGAEKGGHDAIEIAIGPQHLGS